MPIRSSPWIVPKVVAALVVGALVVTALPASARADYASSGSANDDNATMSTFDVTSANISPEDGQFFLDAVESAGANTIQVDADFANAVSQLQLVIHTGTVTNAYLDFVSFGGTTDPRAFMATPLGSSAGALASGTANIFTFDLSGAGTYGLTTSGGFTTGSTYTTIRLTFSFDTAGDALQIDAIANPEPGTLALFGLGALGLGGLVYRRRTARRASGAAPVR